ncbi:unnamed protein product, partial [Phaeothamnion confervicola]
VNVGTLSFSLHSWEAHTILCLSLVAIRHWQGRVVSSVGKGTQVLSAGMSTEVPAHACLRRFASWWTWQDECIARTFFVFFPPPFLLSPPTLHLLSALFFSYRSPLV